MAIYLVCPKCKTEYSIKHKTCPKCNTAAPRKDKNYRVSVTHNGKRIRKTVPNSLELAKEIEAKIKSELVSGVYYNRRVKIPTLDEVWNKYVDVYKVEGKAYNKELSRYKTHIQPRFGKKQLDSINEMSIQKLIMDMKKNKSARGEPYSAKTIKNTIELLSRLFNFAIKQRIYSKENPCKFVKTPRVNNEVVNSLSVSQTKRLLEVLDNYSDVETANLVKLMIFTGMRRGEAFKLEWQDIDFDRGFIHIRNPKGGKDEYIPLNAKALKVLESQNKYKRGNVELVFPSNKNTVRSDINRAWAKIKRLAELPYNFRLHDLRHTFASLLASSGKVDIYTLQKLMTHKTPQMTQRYAHLIEGALKQGTEALVDILSDNVVEADFKKEAK